MASLRGGYRAVVLGATGGIGAALAERIGADPRCGGLVGLGRRDGFELLDEASIQGAAEEARRRLGEIDLLLVATGALTAGGREPERALAEWDGAVMARLFALNAAGPALALKHFAPLLPKDRRSLAAALSARLGSIGDNGLGGWASFRASKAALNQFVRTAANELRRTRPEAVLLAYHPGTVDTGFSAGRGPALKRLSTDEAARRCLAVLDGQAPGASGSFLDHEGRSVDW